MPVEQRMARLKKWIAAVLSNDENSTDAQLVAYFMENGIPALSAWSIVSQRDAYLKGEAA